MTDHPGWIAPGDAATLVWYDAVSDGPDGRRVYQIAGPLLERPPRSPHLVLAPAGESAFAEALYRDEVALAELRRFLAGCTLAHGRIDPSLETLTTSAETPLLPLIDGWREVADPLPVLPYLADISAFFPRDLPVYVSAEAHEAARRTPETFARASVCAECGDAQDASVYLWTAHAGAHVRVCFLIDNEGGRWTCHLYPFDFERTPG